MTIYTAVFTTKGAQVAMISDDGISDHEYFAGYDFMGGANWTKDPSEALLMTLEEADQIADDLTAGEEIDIRDPELSYEISEIDAPLETIIRTIERKNPGWHFDRTEARYQSCVMAIFTRQ